MDCSQSAEQPLKAIDDKLGWVACHHSDMQTKKEKYIKKKCKDRRRWWKSNKHNIERGKTKRTGQLWKWNDIQWYLYSWSYSHWPDDFWTTEELLDLDHGNIKNKVTMNKKEREKIKMSDNKKEKWRKHIAVILGSSHLINGMQLKLIKRTALRYY